MTLIEDDEKDFWRAVFLASVVHGDCVESAARKADLALIVYQRRTDND